MPRPNLLSLIPKPPTITVVDVGAMAIGIDPYQPLINAGIANIIGFEPVEEELAKLQATANPGRKYLPYAIGDGTNQIFHINNFPMTSSLLRPNHALTDHFSGLSELMQVVKSVEMKTHRLDDIPEVSKTDFLKLDIQGAELQVLQAAKHVLENTLMVQTEVEFVPLYENQPLFAEIDQCMRGAGFLLHRLHPLSGRSFKPIHIHDATGQPLFTQALWTDAIYVKDFRHLEQLGPQRLLKLAILADLLCESFDLAYKCLATYDQLMETGLASAYLDQLSRQA